jgi:DNA-binding MarR family transcriptional regulator
MNVTPKQCRLLTVIYAFNLKFGEMPTLREMTQAEGVSKYAVFQHIEALEKKGVLRREWSSSRSAYGRNWRRPRALAMILPNDLRVQVGWNKFASVVLTPDAPEVQRWMNVLVRHGPASSVHGSLTKKQQEVMKILIQRPGIGVCDLAEELGCSHVAIIERVEGMVRKGYVKKERRRLVALKDIDGRVLLP